MLEGTFVVDKFREAFEKHKEKPIALYGFGKYTRLIIQQCSDFNIVAVCGNTNDVSDELFENKPIVAIEEIHRLSDKIVIIARRSFLKEIYERIQCVTEKNNITVYSIYKENLKEYFKQASTELTGNLAHTDKKQTIERIVESLKKYAVHEADYKLIDMYKRSVLEQATIENGKIQITKPEDVGRFFIGPLVLGFLNHAFRKLDGLGNETILWFLARDGYFIQKMYEKFKNKSGYACLPEGKYVLSSRRNLSVVSLQNEEDIKEIIQYSKGIRGDVHSYLKNKLGIYIRQDVDLEMTAEEKVQYVLSYEKEILERATWERQNYFQYLEKEKLFRPQIVLFDLVTSGTSYRYARKMFEEHEIKLLCFQYLNSECDLEGSKEYLWLGEQGFYSREYYFTQLFPICEIIFGPDSTMFLCMDENGVPCYAEDADDKYRKQWHDNIKPIQQAAEAWLDEIYAMMPDCFAKEYSNQLIDRMYALISIYYTEVAECVKQGFELENAFENAGYYNVWKSNVDTFYETI